MPTSAEFIWFVLLGLRREKVLEGLDRICGVTGWYLQVRLRLGSTMVVLPEA